MADAAASRRPGLGPPEGSIATWLGFKLHDPDPKRLADMARRARVAIDVPPGRAAGTPLVLWIGRGERLIETAEPDALAARLERACGAATFQLVDLGEALAPVELSGADTVALLARGCRLDLSSERFPPGSCARTLFAQVPVVIHRPEATRFRLLIDRSLRHFLEDALGCGPSDRGRR